MVMLEAVEPHDPAESAYGTQCCLQKLFRSPVSVLRYLPCLQITLSMISTRRDHLT